jgi:hypothetical protein
VENSAISHIDVLLNGEVQDITPTYGISSTQAGGDFGFAWEWNTLDVPDGPHTLTVRAYAENGGMRNLPPLMAIEEQSLTVVVRNRALADKWTIR